MDTFWYTTFFVFGLCIGSFLNVCIHRMPEERSLVTPPSHCPKCENLLKPYHNIPVLSYIFLGGKCAFCKEKVSLRYPLIELATAMLCVLSLWFCGTNNIVDSAVYAVFLVMLLGLSVIDIDHQIIPHEFNLGGAAFALAVSPFTKFVTWQDALIGAAIGSFGLWSIAWIYSKIKGIEGMGFGDVLLMIFLGAFLGWKAILPIILIGSVTGLLYALPMLALKKMTSDVTIPFGPFLALGGVSYFFWGQQILGVIVR